MDFKSKDEGTWFYFDETEHSIGGVKLRLLTPLEEDIIDKEVTAVTNKPHRGAMVETRKVNNKLRNNLTYNKWIVDWKAIELDGKKLPCNEENKLLMMNNVAIFARFVLDKILEMGDDDAIIHEARVKNLKSSSSGESTE